MQQNDLLPDQLGIGRVFAISTSSTDCYPYSFEARRTCRSDRTFAPDTLYDSCETRAVGRDADGCPKLPGYTFYRGWLLPNASNWRVDDGTRWDRVKGGADAKATAARDMPLMASRCSALTTCAAFQNTGNSTDLLYQLPLPSSWIRAPASAEYCTGIYAKSEPSTACPRIPGYLFTSLLTLDTASAPSSGFAPAGGASASVPCANCSDATAVAVRCDGYSGSSSGGSFCAGFSNYHGLILGSGSSGASGLLTDAPLAPFTSTPCAGLFMRTGRVFPSEVEELDKLLCGDFVYCTSQLRYHAAGTSSATTSAASAAGSSYYVDLSVDVLSDLSLPRGLLDASGGGLRPLPSVRSLVIRCRGGAAMLGGLPIGVVGLMPVLQELRVVGCAASGELPAELTQLRYLRVLDLSMNRLSGSLPEAWANMSLGYLNLSSNLLTGTLPPSWRGILSQQSLSPYPPAPPPPIVLTATAQVSLAAAVPPPPPPPRGGAASMLVADLSANSLGGVLARDYVQAACMDHRMRMQLQGEPSAELMASLGGGRPTFMLQYNPGVAAWAGRYDFAVTGLGGELHGGGHNLCGAARYKIALGVVWGVFGACLLTIVAYSIAAAVREGCCLGFRRASSRGHGFMTEADMALAARAAAGGADDSDAESTDAGPDGGGCDPRRSRLAALLQRLWSRRWVRRLTLLARVVYLAADVALDIRVTVWLFADGDSSSSAVCLAFLVATQAAVSAALWGSLAHHLFESRLLVAAVYPLLLALGPVVGPVLAVANIRNPDVPVVFWRYLELVEFCVALLQAPAEAVTQSVVYARQNQMGGGMYLDHALFLASILLSLGDMLIAAWKLCRYKRGPLRRVLVAITHLDKARDPVDYRKRLRGPRSAKGADADGSSLLLLETPLNPAGGALGRSSRAGSNYGPVGSREGSRERLPMLGPPGGGSSAGEQAPSSWADASSGNQSELQHAEIGTEAAAAPSEYATDEGADAAAPAAPTAHTFTPLTPPRYRPSLLAASASRLGGGGAGPSHAPPVPSRLGPGSNSGRSSITIPAHPPLRPLLPSLPTTPPHPPSRSGAGDGDVERASSSRALGPAAIAAAAAAAAAALEEAERAQQGPRDASAAGPSGVPHGGGGSLSRRSRSVQEGMPPPPLESLASSLVGSLSSDVAQGLAATAGPGPPRSLALGKPPLPRSQPPSRRSSTTGGGRISSGGRSGGEPPLSGPSGSLHSEEDARFLSSAAVAAEAALASERESSGSAGSSGAVSSSSGPTPGGPAPAGLTFSPDGRRNAGSATSSSAGSPKAAAPGHGASLRQVASIREGSASHSASVSPARRRGGEALSIAVPASPVHDSGIEVIRMSRSSSARHTSPGSSRGCSTPVVSVRLPPPPQPPPWLAPGAPAMPPRPHRPPEG